MEGTGAKAILWSAIGAELISVVYDLRYMVMLSVALILADLWWGYSDNMKRLEEARKEKNKTLIEKYKWRKSKAVRRTTNKFIDYATYLVVGALMGLGITEQMDICNHVWTAAIGLGIGCGCEIASIIGHVAYVKMGIELSVADAWNVFVRFLGRLIKSKSEQIGEAVEDIAGHSRHHHDFNEPAEIEPYNED